MVRKYPPAEFGPGQDEVNEATLEHYTAVGKLLIEWAKGGPATWPKNMDELRMALEGNLWFPEQVKRLKVVQSDDSEDNNYEFILRLPAKGQVTESETLAAGGTYDPPPVIRIINTGIDTKKPEVTKLDIFHARVADYTMRQCR